MRRVLIVFAKEPIRGMVKTRLKSCFSGGELTQLYKAFIRDTLAIAKRVRNTRKILAFASAGIPQFLRSISQGFELIEQTGRTLGDRMLNAIVYARGSKSKKTVIIGTDSPTLPPSVIEKAFRELSKKDVIIGPSVDGGYYLIGMKEPLPEIFKGIRWSSRSVTRKTLQNARDCGKTAVLLDEWYDVDDRSGLLRLESDLARGDNQDIAKYTTKALRISRSISNLPKY